MKSNYGFEDITPGKLTDITDIKILICYILYSVKESLSKESIIEILCGNELADYFDASVAISELLETGGLKPGDNGCVAITDKGRSAADTLESSLPLSVREKAVEQALKLMTRTKREAENEVKIEREGNSWRITFIITDGTDEMLNLKLYVSDELQAQNLKEKFLANPTKLYSGIVDSLLK